MPRPYAQRARAQSAARTAAAIDAATLRELALHRYAHLRMADVATRAGVGLRTLYLRAASKDALVAGALRARAAALGHRVERWRPQSEDAEGILDELVALHERTYRTEKQLLEVLVDGGGPDAAPVLRSLDLVRLAIIARTTAELARRGALRVRLADATALAHALLSYPTWRTALTGPAGRRSPRLLAASLRSAILSSRAP